MHIKRLHLRLPIPYRLYRSTQIDILSILYIIRSVGIIKPVHKNLVHNRPLDPGRNKEIRKNRESILCVELFRHSQPIIMQNFFPLHNLKIIV